MFADVAGSSRLYQPVGDRVANRQISELVQNMGVIVKQHGGVVIKTIGDEIMAHIVSPLDARDAATALQQLAQNRMPMRIGLAWGEVIEKNADLFGRTVNDAAAVAKIARGGQVITTAAFHQQLGEENAAGMRLFDRVRLKGRQFEIEVYRLEWKSEDVSRGNGHTLMTGDSDRQQESLTLIVQPSGSQSGRSASVVTIRPEDTPFTIGRSDEVCQLAIHEGFVSREHCQITYEHGKFVLRDHSSNGTHVTTQYDQTIFLRRGDFPLTGSGRLAIGRAGDEGDLHVIGYGP